MDAWAAAAVRRRPPSARCAQRPLCAIGRNAPHLRIRDPPASGWHRHRASTPQGDSSAEVRPAAGSWRGRPLSASVASVARTGSAASATFYVMGATACYAALQACVDGVGPVGALPIGTALQAVEQVRWESSAGWCLLLSSDTLTARWLVSSGLPLGGRRGGMPPRALCGRRRGWRDGPPS
jgi:hypothetical protein